MATWDLVITSGQSQMVGHGYAINPAPATNGAMCMEWDDTNFVELSDDQYDYSAPNTYKAQTGSCLPAFCITYTAGTGRPVVVVRSAIDGTALLHANAGANDDWSTDGNLFDNSVARALAAIAAIGVAGHTLGRVFVIWSQGGKDAGGGNWLLGTGAGSYYEAQIALVDRYRAALSLPTLKVYIERMYVINSIDPDKCLQVQLAQDRAVAAAPDKLAYGFVDGESFKNTPRVNLDGVHYSMDGLNKMGMAYALNVLDDQGITEPEIPPIVPAGTSPTSSLSRRLLQMPPQDPLPRMYDAPGTYLWLCPSYTYFVDLTIDAGGGGAKGGTLLSTGGGGGGGGERRVITAVPVTPGVLYTVTVGAGGAGVTYNTAGTGGTGGDSTLVVGGTTYRAKGGLGGGSGTARTGGAGGTGGTGGTGTNGSAGGTAANTTNSDGGAGGTSGAGAAGGIGGTGNTGEQYGKPGATPGGGGGGGRGNAAAAHGGSGAAGSLLITRSI